MTGNEWEEKRKEDLKRWLESEKPIIDPGQYTVSYTKHRLNIPIMAFNEWENKNFTDKPRRFRTVKDFDPLPL